MNLELVFGSVLQFVVIVGTRRTIKGLGLDQDLHLIAGRQFDPGDGVQAEEAYLGPHTRLELQNRELFGLVLRQTHIVLVKNDVLVLFRRG